MEMSVSCCTETSYKVCGDCKTSKTPLWRTGPAGPKTLCNACGIRFRKKRGGCVGSDKKKELKLMLPSRSPSPTSSFSSSNVDGGGGEMMRSDWRTVMILQRRRSPTRKVKRRKYNNMRFGGEVEEAAFVLMSLSCGLVYG